MGGGGDDGQAAIVILLSHPLTKFAGVLFNICFYRIFSASLERLLGVSKGREGGDKYRNIIWCV